jgi:threonine dehydratase
MDTASVHYVDVAAAAQRIDGQVHRTPVMNNRHIDRLTGARVFFKCENFQRVGAFKFRGALNAMLQLDTAQRKAGVLAYSSGNHAQAIALAGQLLGTPTVIVMPSDAPVVKRQATEGYGAQIMLYDKHTTVREELAVATARERGLAIIPPYDHKDVIAGQGTAAKELIDAVGKLDYLFVPVGGGGLISGCALAASALSAGCKVIGVEPEAGDDATRSFHSKALQTCTNPDTVADGARTPYLGKLTFPLVLEYVHNMVTVDDVALLKAMFMLWERMKIIVEPTGALGIAGLLEAKIAVPAGAKVGVVLSGGNVDFADVGGWRSKMLGR